MSSVKIVRFRDLQRWDIGFHFGKQDLKSKFKLEYLEKILVPRKEKIKPNEYDGKTPIVSKIPFALLHIELRKEPKTRMDMYAVYNGDLLVSNINFHQGAVAICKENKIYASTHYQPYIVNEKIINKDFLYLILKQNSYLEYIATKRTKGIKTESNFSFIKKLQIPLPPLEIQNEIINKLKAIEDKIKALQDERAKFEKEINEYMYRALGISQNDQILNKSGIKIVRYRDLNLFDYKSNAVKLGELTSLYPQYKFGDFLVRRLDKVKIDENAFYKRVTIKTKGQGCFLRDCLKGNLIKTKNQFLVKQGQFLISKIDARNGAFGVAGNEIDNAVITGNFWTYDIDTSKVNVCFLTLLMATQYFIDLFKSCSSGTTGRTYLNENKFLSIKIPLPSLKDQNNLISKLTNIDEKIEKLSVELILSKEKAIKDLWI